MKILIVDDSKFMREYIKKTLWELKKTCDISFFEASSGTESIEMFNTIKPDIITMDMVLGDISGIKATKEIKKIDDNVKIIMCSSMGQKCLIKDAIQAGINDFILKPFQDKELINSVSNITKRLLVG